MSLRIGKGWHNEPLRHSLARKGVKTGTGVKSPKLPKEISGYAKRFHEGYLTEKSEHPELSDRTVEQLVRDHLAENPDYYSLKGNPAEVRGQQLRIRVLEPRKNARYRTHDVGKRGRLMLTLMDGEVQSYRINLKDYPTRDMALFEVSNLNISREQKAEAVRLINNYWGRNR